MRAKRAKAKSIIVVLLAVMNFASCSNTSAQKSVKGNEEVVVAEQVSTKAGTVSEHSANSESNSELAQTIIENSNHTVCVYTEIKAFDSYLAPLPIVRAKPHSLTPDECRRFAEALIGNVQFYETSIEPIMSRSIAEQKAKDWELLNTPETITDIFGKDRLNQVKGAIQQRIDTLNETDLLETNNVTRRLCQWEFNAESSYAPEGLKPISDDGNKTIMAYVEKDQMSYRLWCTSRDEKDYKVQTISLYPNTEYTSPFDIETLHMIRTVCGSKKPTSLDVEKAKEKSQNIINSAGIGNWSIVDTNVEIYKYWKNSECPAYVIIVTAVPNYSGINILHFSQLDSIKGKGTPNYYYSELTLTFSSSGEIIEALLTSPLDYISEIESDIGVIEPLQAVEILVDYLSEAKPALFDSLLGNQNGCTVEARIDNAVMGLARVRADGSKSEYDLIPAIQFTGDFTVFRDGEPQYSYEELCGEKYEFAVVSITDGSSINTRRGY